MEKNKQQIYDFVKLDEGGYTDDPHDNGGATTWGITIAEVSQWRGRPVTKEDMRNFTIEESRKILDAWYWIPLKCDFLPTGIDYMVFDGGLMSGIVNGARWLQFAVGTTPDGKIGPKTIGAAAVANAEEVIRTIYDYRVRRARNHPDYWKFGRGWLNRFVRVRTRALKMIGTT